jgi:hypothetical protein
VELCSQHGAPQRAAAHASQRVAALQRRSVEPRCSSAATPELALQQASELGACCNAAASKLRSLELAAPLQQAPEVALLQAPELGACCNAAAKRLPG